MIKCYLTYGTQAKLHGISDKEITSDMVTGKYMITKYHFGDRAMYIQIKQKRSFLHWLCQCSKYTYIHEDSFLFKETDYYNCKG